MGNETSSLLLALLYIGSACGLYNIYDAFRRITTNGKEIAAIKKENLDLKQRIANLEKRYDQTGYTG